MPILPVDVIRAQEASQIKHIENQRVNNAQDQVARTFQNTINQEQYKPTQMNKSESKEYRYDAKEKGSNEYHGSGEKKKNKQQEEKAKPKDPKKSGGIDILI